MQYFCLCFDFTLDPARSANPFCSCSCSSNFITKVSSDLRVHLNSIWPMIFVSFDAFVDDSFSSLLQLAANRCDLGFLYCFCFCQIKCIEIAGTVVF